MIYEKRYLFDDFFLFRSCICNLGFWQFGPPRGLWSRKTRCWRAFSLPACRDGGSGFGLPVSRRANLSGHCLCIYLVLMDGSGYISGLVNLGSPGWEHLIWKPTARFGEGNPLELLEGRGGDLDLSTRSDKESCLPSSRLRPAPRACEYLRFSRGKRVSRADGLIASDKG